MVVEQRQVRLMAYFDGQIEACGRRRVKLEEDDRADEAAFEKVKANVYDIFRTVFTAAVRAGGGDAEAVRDFFLLKTEQIPSNWAASCDKAKQYGDVQRERIESIKLDVVREVRTVFERIWEGEK